MHKGGNLYGFCPAKATWDHKIVGLYRELCLIAELKQFPDGKSIQDQDHWMIDLVSWFLPTYDFMKFIRKADMILGDNGKSNAVKPVKPSGRRR